MRNKSLILVMISSSIIFLFITMNTIYNDGTRLDDAIINWSHNITSPFFVEVLRFLTYIGSGEFIMISSIIISTIFLFRKDLYHALFLMCVTGSGILFNFILKVAFQRERPGEMSYIEVFGYSFELASYSFPSGHMMRTVLLFSFFIYFIHSYFLNRIVKVSLYLLSITITLGVGASRVVLGAHFPSDIIAAIFISITWFILCYFSFKAIFSKKNKNEHGKARFLFFLEAVEFRRSS
ncbi:phosphatase PAP2 family protein [Evansella cellulosilytica]|uniref:Phosphoesterase PA-phosphatase related protein n=1 Tax=Evansella cellulosilytica (strain ATCC 21833 / DSM 2522 / FERM P-1141 / JCM 9156 / N-4) TaxID=649639 RepID=E6TQW6_EVAC2|nr:phosphatase PAP2 family protein [Evansella cellulosilytica]ADU31741.1 phosphoesterase PA-phosphatase related protein [Evansella cellulosilytica DSM 2522]